MTALTADHGAGRSYLVRDVLVMTRRYVLHYLRVPVLVFFSLVQPVIFVLLFRYVFGGAIRVQGADYVDFLIPGVIAQTAAFSCFATAIGLAQDLKQGIIDRFRSLPMSRSALLIGRLAADTLRTLVVVLVLLAVGFVVGFRVHTGFLQAVAMVLIATLFGLAVCCISASIGLGLKDEEAVQSFGLVWLFPLTFASSAFVPVGSMPGWLQAFAKVNPVTVVVDELRHLVLGGPVLRGFWGSLGWIVAILAVFGPLAVRAYRRAS